MRNGEIESRCIWSGSVFNHLSSISHLPSLIIHCLLPKTFARGLGLDQVGAGAGGDEEGRAVDAAGNLWVCTREGNQVFTSILRTAWFCMSTTKRLPRLGPKRSSCGRLNVAAVAGPPSPV